MGRGSIYRRLILQLVGSAALLATILFLIVQSFSRQLAVEAQDNTLLASATAILESVSVQQGEVVADIPYFAFAMLGNVSQDRVFYKIVLGQQVLTGYDDLPARAQAGPHSWTARYRGQDVRLAQVTRGLPTGTGTGQLHIVLAQTQDGLVQKLAWTQRVSVLLGLAFFAVAALLAVLTARSSVRPLSVLAEAVARRGPSDLRPVAAPVPTEMAPLVDALNAFIARLERSLSRSEEFIAEAAHRIRTPLATVRTQAQVTLRRIDREENRTALRQMIRAVDDSSRAAGQMLNHAMVTFRTDALKREALDLGEILRDLIEHQRAVADLKDTTLWVQIAPGDCGLSGDAILIQNAIGNILDNAIKYSPPETAIDVRLTCGDEGPILRIADEGPGFAGEDIDTLSARFVRGRNAGATVGSGLGLTIAQEVLRAHGGTVTLTDSDGGGGCVTLQFSR